MTERKILSILFKTFNSFVGEINDPFLYPSLCDKIDMELSKRIIENQDKEDSNESFNITHSFESDKGLIFNLDFTNENNLLGVSAQYKYPKLFITVKSYTYDISSSDQTLYCLSTRSFTF